MGGRAEPGARWLGGSLDPTADPREVQAPAPGLARRLVSRTGYSRLRTWAAAHGEAVPDAGLY
jgi:hypothetical protein